jgi:Xaa-Pro aminopeptidase
MTHKEKDWLNGYHAEVFEKIGPHVEGEVLKWLEKAVKSI